MFILHKKEGYKYLKFYVTRYLNEQLMVIKRFLEETEYKDDIQLFVPKSIVLSPKIGFVYVEDGGKLSYSRASFSPFKRLVWLGGLADEKVAIKLPMALMHELAHCYTVNHGDSIKDPPGKTLEYMVEHHDDLSYEKFANTLEKRFYEWLVNNKQYSCGKLIGRVCTLMKTYPAEVTYEIIDNMLNIVDFKVAVFLPFPSN